MELKKGIIREIKAVKEFTGDPKIEYVVEIYPDHSYIEIHIEIEEEEIYSNEKDAAVAAKEHNKMWENN